jgi:GDP-mannose 6-dehydrogenase
MKISIFGLGYVGCVSCAVLCKDHDVVGVDVAPAKVDLIRRGQSPIVEKETDDLIRTGVEAGRLSATLDYDAAVACTDISIVCVGTPTLDNGAHDLAHVEGVVEQIAAGVRHKSREHLIVLRSTVPPGTTERLMREKLGGLPVRVCFNPEFLREGCAVADYHDPPFIVLAGSDDRAVALAKSLYDGIDAEFVVTSFREAETIKVLCNVFHAMKIVFANEVARLGEAIGVDGGNIMRLLCKDTKLNISSTYLKPGFAYGGSCLPKDLRSLEYLARQANVRVPLISSIEASNNEHIAQMIRKISGHRVRSLGFVGISFKKGTDDLRESPFVRLVEHFMGKGYRVKIYDKDVVPSGLIGANKRFIDNTAGHILNALVQDASELRDCELIVVCKDGMPQAREVYEGKIVIDVRGHGQGGSGDCAVEKE